MSPSGEGSGRTRIPHICPLAILVELKDDAIPDPLNADSSLRIRSVRRELDALDAEIRSVFPADTDHHSRLCTAAASPTLEAAVLADRLAALGRARGK